MKLEITKEKVLEAASKCSTAKQTLQVLFPEAFKNDINIVDIRAGSVFVDPTGTCNSFVVVETRYKNYNDKSYTLLGLGCGINSSHFFESTAEHTAEEVRQKLISCKMQYSHNINGTVSRLLQKAFADKVENLR